MEYTQTGDDGEVAELLDLDVGVPIPPLVGRCVKP